MVFFILSSGYRKWLKDKRSIIPLAAMPLFESIRPSKKARANSDDLITGDRYNDSDRDLSKSHTSRVEGDHTGTAGFLKKTWKHCKRPG